MPGPVHYDRMNLLHDGVLDMTYSNITSLLRSTLSLSCAGLLAGLLASACDLPDKNLGE